jgi:hypothetical protein
MIREWLIQCLLTIWNSLLFVKGLDAADVDCIIDNSFLEANRAAVFLFVRMLVVAFFESIVSFC